MKARLYNQTLAHRFGIELTVLLEAPQLRAFSFAVAWARRSGVKRLETSLTSLLHRGGSIRGTVGVDIENTSQEGLEDLLKLSGAGDARFWIYHDENQRSVFHPKIYLLEAERDAILIVASNNLTEQGLYTNTEAGLHVEATRDEAVIKDARAMLQSWQDEHSEFVRPLTKDSLEELVERGYVMPERALRERRRASEGHRRTERRPLFGKSRSTVPPLPPRVEPTRPDSASTGTVLLMRVRRASEKTRRTQVQVPIRVRRLDFFKDVDSVVSAVSGEKHYFRIAHARGGDNTIKLEIPEIDRFVDPLVRFERDEGVIRYTAYDAASPKGRQIMAKLDAGRGATGNPTTLTVPARPKSATWWRFV